MSVAIDLISPLLGPIETRRQERLASRHGQEQLYLELQDAVFRTTADLNKIRSIQPLYRGALTQFMSFPHFLRSMDAMWDDICILSSALARLRLAGCPPRTWEAAGELGDAASRFAAILTEPPRWRRAARRINQTEWEAATDELSSAMTKWIDAIQLERAETWRLRKALRRLKW